MAQINNEKIAVIGGGVIGLCTAYQLQKKGYCVTIFDGSGVANGASFGNAGHFATEQVFPLANPALLGQLPKMLVDPFGPFKIRANYFFKALPWFCRFMLAMRPSQINKNTAAIRALNERSMAQWSELLTEIGAQQYLTQQGSLLTYEKDNTEQLEQDYRHYLSEGIAVEKLSSSQVLALEPCLSNKVSGALYFTRVGHTVSPEELCQKIYQAFTKLGGKMIAKNIDSISNNNNPLTIETSDNSYTVDKLVVCAGAHSKELTRQLGYKVPLEVERGYHLMLPVDVKLNRPIASADRKFIMTPMKGGLRLVGTVEFGGLYNEPNYRCSEMMLTHAKALLPELKDISLCQLNEQSRWMGFRPSLPDSLPIIDCSKHNANVFFNFGHQHLGLTWGAISGELMSQLIAGQTNTVDLTPYRVNRF